MTRLARLLSPQVIAVIGGGAWCESIIGAARQLGFEGRIVPVHPVKPHVAGLPATASLAEIDAPIDAAFIGVNRFATLEIVAELNALGAGGAICFASGFLEAAAEDEAGGDLQAQLVAAAGEMPILGPNCYGFLNALDRAGIWPDQHGLVPVERGVAILTQSSNIAINLTMQTRGLPLAMMLTCGNQAQTTQADLALHLLDDPRITALGLHIEGFGDLRAWEALAAKARKKNIPLIAIKSGRSAQAQAAAISHTASMAGADAGADALLTGLGIARVDSVPVFLEALKAAHLFGQVPGRAIASISCSGGEAALAADAAVGSALFFPALTETQEEALGAVLGPMVALANPLDYHTYIWRDEAAMTACFAAMAGPGIDVILIILDLPRPDRCDASDWDIALRAVAKAAEQTGARFAVCASLPELLPEAVAQDLLAGGVLPLHGLDHAIKALEAVCGKRPETTAPVALPGTREATETLTESAAKAALAAHGLPVPLGAEATRATAADVAEGLGFPVVLKVMGLAHKTGQGGLALNLGTRGDVEAALAQLADGPLWVEQMIPAPIVELLVGVTRDPAHGFLLTVAAGGTLTELLHDQQNLLLPASTTEIEAALRRLRLAPRLAGYRGEPPVNMAAALAAIDAIQSYVLANAATVAEVEVNPLILTKHAAIAADALIRKAPDDV